MQTSTPIKKPAKIKSQPQPQTQTQPQSQTQTQPPTQTSTANQTPKQDRPDLKKYSNSIWFTIYLSIILVSNKHLLQKRKKFQKN